MDEAYYLDLIARKLSKEAMTSAEHAELERILHSESKYRQFFDLMQKEWSSGQEGRLKLDHLQKYEMIKMRLGLSTLGHTLDQTMAGSRKSRPMREWRIFKVAAMFIFLFAAGFGIYFFLLNSSSSRVVPEAIVKHNDIGQKSLITLPDGSRVKLNAESKLTYYSNFADARRVDLEGEAFFEIQHDETKPFRVYTNNMMVKVLGTSFNVGAYPGEGLSVAVATGKVAVFDGDDEQHLLVDTLKANRKLIYDISSGHYAVQAYDPDTEIAWKDGVIKFEDATMAEVISKLERWYGVEVEVENEVHLMASFSGRYVNEPLEIVLDGMSFAIGFDYEINGKKVIIQ
jgi:ferric-dicitrate binding protein FerR (iron transport regulator)